MSIKTNSLTYRCHKLLQWLTQLSSTQLYYQISIINSPSVSLGTETEGSVSGTFIMIKAKPMYPYNNLSLTHGFKILSAHLHPILHSAPLYRVQPRWRSTQGKDGCQMQLTQRASNTLLPPFISLHKENSTRPLHASCHLPICFFVLGLGEIWSLLGLVGSGTWPLNSDVPCCTVQPLKNERWCSQRWHMTLNGSTQKHNKEVGASEKHWSQALSRLYK